MIRFRPFVDAGYLICYRSTNITLVPDRLILLPVDRTSPMETVHDNQGSQQSPAAWDLIKTYVMNPLQNITGCQMDNKGCVLLVYDTKQVGMTLKVSRPWTLDFVRELRLPVVSIKKHMDESYSITAVAITLRRAVVQCVTGTCKSCSLV